MEITQYYVLVKDDAIYNVKCSKGHKAIVMIYSKDNIKGICNTCGQVFPIYVEQDNHNE